MGTEGTEGCGGVEWNNGFQVLCDFNLTPVENSSLSDLNF